MARHTLERALARRDLLDGNGVHESTGEALEIPALHMALAGTLEDLLGEALQVRDAPPVLRTFARTTKHMIPAMLDGLANVPPDQVREMLVHIHGQLVKAMPDLCTAAVPVTVRRETDFGTLVAGDPVRGETIMTIPGDG